MSDAFSSVSPSDLDHVHGGQQPPAATPAPSALQVGGKFAKKVVPVLEAADAADGAITDYQKARAAGDNVIPSMGSHDAPTPGEASQSRQLVPETR